MLEMFTNLDHFKEIISNLALLLWYVMHKNNIGTFKEFKAKLLKVNKKILFKGASRAQNKVMHQMLSQSWLQLRRSDESEENISLLYTLCRF